MIGEGVEFLAQFGDEGEFFAIEDAAGGIVGRVQDDGFGALRKSPAQLVAVEGPIGCAQSHQLAGASAEHRIGAVVFIEGFEDHQLITGVSDASQGRDHAFGGSADHGDFTLGVEVELIMAAILRGDGVAKRLRAPGDGVLIDVGFDGFDGGSLYDFGGGEIGVALREIHGVVLKRQARHFADDTFVEAGGAFAAEARANARGRRWRESFFFADRSHLNRIPGWRERRAFHWLGTTYNWR